MQIKRRPIVVFGGARKSLVIERRLKFAALWAAARCEGLNTGRLACLLAVKGDRLNQFAGKIQQRNGLAKDDVEMQLNDWESSADASWFGKK